MLFEFISINFKLHQVNVSLKERDKLVIFCLQCSMKDYHLKKLEPL